MPSMMVIGDVAATSGGSPIVSGDLFSGQYFPISEIQLKLADGAPGVVYIGLPPPSYLSGVASGSIVTLNSGGQLSSGGMNDGFEVGPGDGYAPPKSRLTSGILSIRVIAPAASSGGRLFWEVGALFLVVIPALEVLLKGGGFFLV